MSLLANFLVPFEHTSTFVFPLTSELWLWQKSRSLHALVNFHYPRSPFRVFNLRTFFLGQVAFSGFQLDLFLFLFGLNALSGFNLKLFFSFSFFFLFVLLAIAALSDFQLWRVISLGCLKYNTS